MKYEFRDLVIEVTRRCNMCCEHCLRGDAQDKDISFDIIDKLLENTAFIGSLTITGGEPSLNAPAISYIADQIKKRDIGLDSVFLATNGKDISDEFILACIKLFMLADHPGMNGLALSQDMFHEDASYENIQKLAQLAAYDKVSKNTNFNKEPMLDIGRAKALNGFTKKSLQYYLPKMETLEQHICVHTLVSITVDGDILSNCDYSYDTTNNLKIGTVFDRPEDLAKKISYSGGVRKNK